VADSRTKLGKRQQRGTRTAKWAKKRVNQKNHRTLREDIEAGTLRDRVAINQVGERGGDSRFMTNAGIGGKARRHSAEKNHERRKK